MSNLYNRTGDVRDGFSGFNELMKEVSDFIKVAENPNEILLTGAKEFVNDLSKLTKPMSKIRKSGYTHLINTFALENKDKEVIVGWGKYYGRMVELGTEKMSAKAHMYPLWDRNKERYYKTMLTKAGIKS